MFVCLFVCFTETGNDNVNISVGTVGSGSSIAGKDITTTTYTAPKGRVQMMHVAS